MECHPRATALIHLSILPPDILRLVCGYDHGAFRLMPFDYENVSSFEAVDKEILFITMTNQKEVVHIPRSCEDYITYSHQVPVGFVSIGPNYIVMTDEYAYQTTIIKESKLGWNIPGHLQLYRLTCQHILAPSVLGFGSYGLYVLFRILWSANLELRQISKIQLKWDECVYTSCKWRNLLVLATNCGIRYVKDGLNYATELKEAELFQASSSTRSLQVTQKNKLLSISNVSISVWDFMEVPVCLHRFAHFNANATFLNDGYAILFFESYLELVSVEDGSIIQKIPCQNVTKLQGHYVLSQNKLFLLV